MTESLTKNSEEVLASLRSLYGRYGYSHYKMNKFEEYDLYANNKNFLISDSIITFTDGNGKLLALKPDVTLSIVKNSKDDGRNLQKLCYNENVYRVSKGSRNYKEIMQVGLECIGSVDGYCISEVLRLALRSLDEISKSSVLSVSHLGILSELMDSIGIPADAKDDVIRFIGEKNLHELTYAMASNGVNEEGVETMKKLVAVNGTVSDVLDKVCTLLDGKVSESTLDEFSKTVSALKDEKSLNIDFSVVGDLRYYNGFVFKGYVREIPTSVLSGGQYDLLMRKMGRSSLAIGFAVYLDLIDQYNLNTEKFDVDTVLLYDGSSTPAEIAAVAEKLRADGESVLTDTTVPEMIKYKKLLRVVNGEVASNE